jgi:hypothetical protein
MKKLLTMVLLLLSFPVLSAPIEIHSVVPTFGGFNINGIALQRIGKIKINNTKLNVDTFSHNFAFAFCKNPNTFPCINGGLIAGDYILSFYKKGVGKPFMFLPIKVTEMEQIPTINPIYPNQNITPPVSTSPDTNINPPNSVSPTPTN